MGLTGLPPLRRSTISYATLRFSTISYADDGASAPLTGDDCHLRAVFAQKESISGRDTLLSAVGISHAIAFHPNIGGEHDANDGDCRNGICERKWVGKQIRKFSSELFC